MSDSTQSTGAPANGWADLRDALERLTNRVRDPEAARRSLERMDRMREENRKRLGVQSIAVELIREARGNQ